MLVLFETPAGFAIFKLLNEKLLKNPDDIYKSFQSIDDANQVVKLQQFSKFEDTTQALAAATALVEGKMSSDLKKLLKKVVTDTQEELLVSDAKLGNSIKDKFDVPCLANSSVQELMRGIRSQINGLISGLADKEMAAFALGLAHSLSRYKLKFSPDKVDTMIVQAVSLLDDIDKELNNYNMRCREWYGWHFPELSKIITDHVAFAKVIKAVGHRTNAAEVDLKDILPEELEAEVKEAAEISMGSEVTDDDILNIQHLCDQILDMHEYRGQLYDYLKTRMFAVAPNLTVLVGEIIGARLIAHAGSLLNLSKHPSSTIQILGAEKALFRALKTKHDTPKYGLIYHAALINQASTKLKGKISRMLAAKTALAVRVDALGESTDAELGAEHKANLEARLQMLETGQFRKLTGRGNRKADLDKYTNKAEVKVYNSAADVTIGVKVEGDERDGETPQKKVKKVKKVKAEAAEEDEEPTKKKKRKSVSVKTEVEEPEVETPKPKKKKKAQADEEEATGKDADPDVATPKPKKKKKAQADEEEATGKDADPDVATPKPKKKKAKADEQAATPVKSAKKKKKQSE